MSQYIDQIRTLLHHEHFDDLANFPEIADEENFTTEYKEKTLNEAIVDFERICETIEIALDEDLFTDIAIEDQMTIAKQLKNVRKEANNIKNRNGRRNNPGRDFIQNVESLKSHVFGQLSLDLRVGEYLDLSEQLGELKEIREEQQEATQVLQEAQDASGKIDQLHEKITNQKNEITGVVDSAEEFQEDLNTAESQIKTTLQQVEKEAETVSEMHEDVLTKKKEIESYESRLEDNLSAVEERANRMDDQQEELDEVEDRIDTLLNGAIAASLDKNFTARKKELETSATRWARLTFGAIIALIVGASVIFENITQAGGFGAGTISRVTLLIPLLVGVWFTSKNYSRKRRLMEEYAFKSTMAQTLEPSRKVLESQQSLDETDAQLAEFMLVSMGQMFTNPSDIVEHGSTTTDDDATNIETVMDLAKRIAKSD